MCPSCVKNVLEIPFLGNNEKLGGDELEPPNAAILKTSENNHHLGNLGYPQEQSPACPGGEILPPAGYRAQESIFMEHEQQTVAYPKWTRGGLTRGDAQCCRGTPLQPLATSVHPISYAAPRSAGYEDSKLCSVPQVPLVLTLLSS